MIFFLIDVLAMSLSNIISKGPLVNFFGPPSVFKAQGFHLLVIFCRTQPHTKLLQLRKPPSCKYLWRVGQRSKNLFLLLSQSKTNFSVSWLVLFFMITRFHLPQMIYFLDTSKGAVRPSTSWSLRHICAFHFFFAPKSMIQLIA